MPGLSSGAAFVGRSSELAAFTNAVEAARLGAPAVLLVGGEAGIGKSALAAEGARRAGVELLVGGCIPRGGELIPMAPLTELLRNVRRARPAALSGSAMRPLREWIAPPTGGATPVEAALFSALLQLLADVGTDGPVVVAFEDLHWGDPLTWDLFDFLARNLVDERVVLIGTYRDTEVSRSPQQRRRLGELVRLRTVQQVQLTGLDRAEVAEKIRTLVDGAPSSELVDAVFDRSQGNPFFTTELVTARLNGQAVPAVLSDLIADDLARLDPHTRSVVEAIAVVGRDTDHELLASVADLQIDALELALRTAIDEGLVVVDRGTDTFRFRHALIGEVVYDRLLPPRRQRLHRVIADALSARAGELRSRADRAGELAVHLDRAGDHEAAFGALLRAVDAGEAVAPRAASAHLERALELWESAGDAAAAEDRCGRLWQAAELASGAVGNQRAVDLARAAFAAGPPPRGAAWGHERLGRYLWAAGHLADCAAEFDAAASLVSDGSAPDAAAVIAGLGQAELMLGDYDTAEARARRVFELLGSAEADPAAWAMAERVLGIVVDHRGDPVDGVRLCRTAVATSPTAGTRTLALLYLGVALLDAGAYGEVVDEMVDARADARRTGLERSFGGYLDALAAEALVRLGRLSEADTILDHSYDTAAFPLGEVRLGLAGALLASRRGDRDRARTLVGEAEQRPVDPFHRWFLDRTAAECALALGDWADAAAITEEALRRGPTALWRARFLMYATVAAVELTLDARARREAVDTVEIAAALRDRLHSVGDIDDDANRADRAAHLAHARAAISRLEAPDAEAWSDAALAWARLGDPYWEATARVREADAAAALGAAAVASEALREAHRLAESLPSESLAAEIEAVARRTRLSVEPPTVRVIEADAIDRLGLTAREAEVLSLVAAGRTNRQIGETLFVSDKTASVHVSNILRKLGVTSRVEAAAIAQRLGVD